MILDHFKDTNMKGFYDTLEIRACCLVFDIPNKNYGALINQLRGLDPTDPNI
jgi:hypothetical protein